MVMILLNSWYSLKSVTICVVNYCWIKIFLKIVLKMKLHQSLCNFASMKEIHLHINNIDRYYLNKNLLARLMLKLKWIGYHHFCNLSVVGNDKSILNKIFKIKKFVKFLILLYKRSLMTLNKLFTTFQIMYWLRLKNLLSAEVYSLRFHLKLWIMQITWFRLKSFSETLKLPS